MDVKDYSYLWEEEKADYVLVDTGTGYSIMNRRKRNILLVCDDELYEELVKKMLENGNAIYEDGTGEAFKDTDFWMYSELD